jgi:predicted lactoylglutathione lyase
MAIFHDFTAVLLRDERKGAAQRAAWVAVPEEVNTIMANGLKAGGIEPNEMRDYGFMQQRTIEDFDGHTWEIFYMDMSKLPTE